MSRLHSMAAPMFLVAFAGATPPVAQDTMQEFGRDFRGTINGGGPELRINADRREIRLLRCGRPLGVAMIDPEDAIDPRRVAALRRDAIEKLGVIYDPQVVEKIADCIAEKVRRGTVGEGVTYAELVTGSGVPSWVGHRGLLGHVLALVSLQSYDDHQVLLSALTRTRQDVPLPTSGFCGFLEELGLVASRDHRDECLEMWDYHWKKAISHYEVTSTSSG